MPFSPAGAQPISFISITSSSNRGYGILYQDGMVLGSDGEARDTRAILVPGSNPLSRGYSFSKIAANQSSPNPYCIACTYLPNASSYLVPALLINGVICYRTARPNPATGEQVMSVPLISALNMGGAVFSRQMPGYSWG
jgi:hypothetical protein